MQSHKEKICKHIGRDDLMQEKQPPIRCSRKSGGKRNLSQELGGSSEDGIGAAKAGGTIRRKKAVGNTESRSFFMILLWTNVFTRFLPTMRHVASTWIKWFV